MKTPLFSEQKHLYQEPKFYGQGGGVNLAGTQPVYHEIIRLQHVWSGWCSLHSHNPLQTML